MSESRKVAIVGTAPSSYGKAPYTDADWEVWSTSRFWKHIPRWDVWFELHPLETVGKGWDLDDSQREEVRAEHVEFLRSAERPVYVHPTHDAEEGFWVGYPVDEVTEWLREQFGDVEAYFTNTIAWMIALAMYQGVDELGIYGVDMALGSEYGTQRPSCEYFIGLARGCGIDVHVPPESDLLKTPFLYALDDRQSERLNALIRSRRKELKQRKQKKKNEQTNAQVKRAHLLGLTKALEGVIENASSLSDDERQAMQMEAQSYADQANEMEQAMNNAAADERTLHGALDNMEYVEQSWLAVQ